jgi:hypothetical protein
MTHAALQRQLSLLREEGLAKKVNDNVRMPPADLRWQYGKRHACILSTRQFAIAAAIRIAQSIAFLLLSGETKKKCRE